MKKENIKQVLKFVWDTKILWVTLLITILIGTIIIQQTIKYNNIMGKEQDGRTVACNQIYGEGNWEINYSASPVPCQMIKNKINIYISK